MSQKPIPEGSTGTDRPAENRASERASDDGTSDDGTSERVETVVPPDATPARCPHCGQPFPTERLCTLHLGERHRNEWTDDERERYESALDTEIDELFVFHLKVIGALVITFFGFTYTYVFVWS